MMTLELEYRSKDKVYSNFFNVDVPTDSTKAVSLYSWTSLKFEAESRSDIQNLIWIKSGRVHIFLFLMSIITRK